VQTIIAYLQGKTSLHLVRIVAFDQKTREVYTRMIAGLMPTRRA
jgi:hypothetical protein